MTAPPLRMPTLQERLTRIGDLENEVIAARQDFLRAAGWDISSSYPDSVWRWSKQIDGQRLTEIRADDAVRVEEYLMGAE